jgi:hypothetical protein
VMNHAAVLGGAGVGIAFIQVKWFSVHDVLKRHCIILLVEQMIFVLNVNVMLLLLVGSSFLPFLPWKCL